MNLDDPLTPYEKLGKALWDVAHALNRCPLFWWPVLQLNNFLRWMLRKLEK